MASQQSSPQQPGADPTGADPTGGDPAGPQAGGADRVGADTDKADTGRPDRVAAYQVRADGSGSGPAAGGGDVRWTVARPGWRAVAPGLPDEAAALLAPPVVVSTESPRHPGDGRRGEDDDEEEQPGRYPAPTSPCAGDGPGQRPGFLAPAGLRPLARARHRV